ncbi:med6 mediator sub complex component [Trichoderma arundinaceum]|uniref:Mediator of RNA polymerase II transcription subunit 6 n=1 Tax=Trichoderma arundinaceum TaxID=490622 RepID=A0A395NT50_TRIAR|nr:med6 mediator sub complex component [Trichoderma arundinaceum]
MSNPNDPPLDEIQWRSPQLLAQMGGLHSNTILFYFAESPFFERTSNNAVIMAQAMNNMAMYHYIQTREAFETRLKTMSGLEFIVGEEPAETGPGMGTGVWVIRKQTRRKRYQDDDEITVHASFFVMGENIYMAPTLADILASRIMTISSAIAKALPAAEAARKWRPSTGHVYHLPASQTSTTQPKPQEPKEENTVLDVAGKTAAAAAKHDAPSLDRVAEESLMVHLRYGGEYIDEIPITGKPGEFHLSSTGRKPVLPPQGTAPTGISAMSGPPMINTKLDDKKDSKADKTPKSATMPKLKRKKSKMSPSVTPAATPGAS